MTTTNARDPRYAWRCLAGHLNDGALTDVRLGVPVAYCPSCHADMAASATYWLADTASAPDPRVRIGYDFGSGSEDDWEVS